MPGAGGLIVVAEDEAAIADVIRRYLERDGFLVRLCSNGAEALQAIKTDRPMAAILDIGLPELDGLSLCRGLRAAGDWTPVIFVTARDDDVDRILGLEVGGDDYLVKPFNPRELLARVRSVLRRSGTGDGIASEVLQVGQVRVDVGQRRIWAGSSEVGLTATEFELLAFLMRSPGRVFERAALLSSVWGYSHLAGIRTVDVHIASVRAKLGAASPIRTVRGVGYSASSG